MRFRRTLGEIDEERSEPGNEKSTSERDVNEEGDERAMNERSRRRRFHKRLLRFHHQTPPREELTPLLPPSSGFFFTGRTDLGFLFDWFKGGVYCSCERILLLLLLFMLLLFSCFGGRGGGERTRGKRQRMEQDHQRTLIPDFRTQKIPSKCFTCVSSTTKFS